MDNRRVLSACLVTSLLPSMALAAETIYDESKVPDYTLPDPLVLPGGDRIEESQTWWSRRRPQLLRLFRKHVYGKAPGYPKRMTIEVRSTAASALDGQARRKQVVLRFRGDQGRRQSMDLLLYLPKDADGPVPVFLGLNFRGNQAVEDDPGIRLPDGWVRNDPDHGVTDHRATEASRGAADDRWPVEKILARGYGLATACYGDIDPDRNRFDDGIHPLFYEKGQEKPAPDAWGAIGAWAWGLSRAMDYLVTDPAVDDAHVAVMGHSRLGKTALWAGARDPRFALVVSNNSGCGGAALSRRRYGETVAKINASFPHWFCENFTKYNGREEELPVDQHMLLALIAPRPVLVCSAKEDRWADPRGEFLAAKHAAPVYELLGTDGLAVDTQPPPNELVRSSLGYHIRPGGHGVGPRDWEVYLEFADHHFGR